MREIPKEPYWLYGKYSSCEMGTRYSSLAEVADAIQKDNDARALILIDETKKPVVVETIRNACSESFKIYLNSVYGKKGWKKGKVRK